MYACLMLAAIVAAATASRWTQQDMQLSTAQKMAIGAGGFCGAMLAARLPFVLYDRSALWDGSAWFANGKTILAGLVGGYFAVELTKWVLDIHVKTGDHLIVPVAVGVGVGRLACFHAGCCYGTPSQLPWSVVFPMVDDLPRHPTQLYEVAFHLAAAAVLYYLYRRSLLPWQLAKLYIIAYAIYRLLTEAIRPEAKWLLGLTAYQWACLLVIPTFAVLWSRDRRRYVKWHTNRSHPLEAIEVTQISPTR